MATSAAAAETASSAIRSELLAMGTRSPATAPSVAIPTRASSACCSSAVTSTPSRRPTRDGRNGTRRGCGSTGAGSPPPRPPAGPGRDELRRAVRAQAGEAMLLALLEAQAGLAAQAVALPGAADADRIEDGRLDDDGRRPLADLAR